jgi:hypothetical protein
VRNGLLILLTSTTSSIHARKVLLHAVNLRHGTDGFICPPKEVVLRVIMTLKNTSPSVGIEPANLGSSPRSTNIKITWFKIRITVWNTDKSWIPVRHK